MMRQVKKVICTLCGQEISKSNYSKHLRRHSKNPESFKECYYKVTHKGLECQFCGKQCNNANSLRNHERLCKDNPNRQISPFVAYNREVSDGNRSVWNKGLNKDISESVKQQSYTLSHKYVTGEIKPPFKGKSHSEETKKKISKSRIAYLSENPDKVPYILNHSSKESYPEAYFKELFLKEGIHYTYHYRISRYELDFAIENLKLDIEIDGDQHYLDKKQIESDKRRDEYIESIGWKTIRIKWSSWKSSEEYRQDKIKEIKDYMRV